MTKCHCCLCRREQLTASIMQEGSVGCRVVQKFLKILQVVVQEPGQAFKPFLPSILSLCMEQVYPVVAEVSLCSLTLTFILVLMLFAFWLIWYKHGILFLEQKMFIWCSYFSVFGFHHNYWMLLTEYPVFDSGRHQTLRQRCSSCYTKYFIKTGGTSLKRQS